MLPIFFEKPVLLNSNVRYQVVADFEYIQTFPKSSTTGIQLEYSETESVPAEDAACKTYCSIEFLTSCGTEGTTVSYIYSTSGQIRLLYFWPIL